MTKQELLLRLRSLDHLDGEFFIEDDQIQWQYEMDFTCEEPHDHLWDVHCETSNEIRKIIGEDSTDFQIEHAWADNDSCGFQITYYGILSE